MVPVKRSKNECVRTKTENKLNQAEHVTSLPTVTASERSSIDTVPITKEEEKEFREMRGTLFLKVSHKKLFVFVLMSGDLSVDSFLVSHCFFPHLLSARRSYCPLRSTSNSWNIWKTQKMKMRNNFQRSFCVLVITFMIWFAT